MNIESKSKKVRNIITGIVYSSAAEVERLVGVSNSKVSKHCKNKVKKPEWKFI
jgi:hypothetical protein